MLFEYYINYNFFICENDVVDDSVFIPTSGQCVLFCWCIIVRDDYFWENAAR
jgi:hypothetical protein